MLNTLCPFCGNDESTGPMNQEHALPRSLGGNLEPTNQFSIRAHMKCNGTLGKYVDAPFVRSFPLYNARTLTGYQLVDPSRKPVLPLLYMGMSRAWTDASVTCDLWLGPTGDAIYHFHKPYPTSPAFVGRPNWLDDDDADPGVVFVGIVASNPAWHPIILDSVKDAFEGSKLHILNAAPDEQAPPYPPVAPDHQRFVDWISSFTTTERKVQGAVEVNFGDRFIVKLALGVGTALIGDDFVRSQDAALLRTALWARSTSVWPDEILGTGILEEKDPKFVELLNWNRCHSILVSTSGDVLGVTMNLYGKFCASMMISRDRMVWGPAMSSDSKLWLVAPGLRSYAGPMTTMEYAGLLHGSKRSDVSALEQRLAGALKLPAFHLAQPTF
jgi:hypothetical protein